MYIYFGSFVGLFLNFTFIYSFFLQAYQILGMFLQCNKEEEKFKSWLKTTCGANKKQQSDCFLCLQEWCNNHPL